jgi:hypothetical protein
MCEFLESEGCIGMEMAKRPNSGQLNHQTIMINNTQKKL